LCYLQIELFAQCQLDCDAAIALIQKQQQQLTAAAAVGSSESESVAASLTATLIKLLLRRGSALCAQGQFQESYSDYCQALVKFQQLPMSVVHLSLKTISSDAIQSDIDRLKLLCAVESLKKEGDSLIADKQLQNALLKYNEVLQVLPIYVSALSNRAGCRLALGDIDGAVEDCTTAIELLRVNEDSTLLARNNDLTRNMLSAVLPPPQSEKRKQWLLKTTVRKAVALVQLDRLTEAVEEYQQALKLDTANDQIRSDLENLKSYIATQSASSSTTSVD
jgi:tetratricopeptide (TPR) repeat protein